MSRKGQASTEYLVILAVVIIVALVVVAVLGGFIDIGRGAGEQASKSYWRTADIGLVDWTIAGTSGTFVIRNNQDYQVRLTNISVGNSTLTPPTGILAPGATATVSGTTPTCASGDAYAYTVSVTYDNTEHGITGKVFTGAKDIVGTC